MMKRSMDLLCKQKVFQKTHINIQFFGSKMRCRICGGWGGEFGDARGVGSMCKDCYFKQYGSYN